MKTLNRNIPIIAIEGIDGAGKTTVAGLLAKQLGMLYLKTPDKPYSQIRNYFDSKNTDPRIRFHFYIGCLWDAYLKAAAVAEFNGVILDRYILSTYAYHEALCGGDCDVKSIMEIAAPPKADLKIMLKVDMSTAVSRVIKRGEFSSGRELERNVIIQSRASELMENMCEVVIRNERVPIFTTVEMCIDAVNEFTCEILTQPR
jgi:thymidylate kinase